MRRCRTVLEQRKQIEADHRRAGRTLQDWTGRLPAAWLQRPRRDVEELLKRPAAPINDDERNKLRERYRWEVVGPNPL